jgi:Fe-S-cluster containining protein
VNLSCWPPIWIGRPSPSGARIGIAQGTEGITRRVTTEAVFECRECAACCRDASDGRVLVNATDLVRWKRNGRRDLLAALVPGHFGQPALPAQHDGSCRYLGTPHSPLDCSIYDDRGSACRAVEPGSPQCRQYRRSARMDREIIV